MMLNTKRAPFLLPVLMCLWFQGPTLAQEATGDQSAEKEDLAQELTNPMANLVTIPFQMNYDSGIGSGDEGSKMQINMQPVYPFSLGSEWNLISRTIVSLTYQDEIFPEAGSQFGLGDINLSLFFFACKADLRAGLGSRSGPSPAHRHRLADRRQEVGRRTVRCRAHDAGPLDDRCTGQPPLVFCRGQRSCQHQ